jgi:hypothetical protein
VSLRTWRRIGVDVDGVLADFNTSYIRLIAKTTGVQLPAADDTYPTTWFYPEAAGIPKAEIDRVWRDGILPSPRWWNTLPCYDTTIDDADALANCIVDDDEVYAITSRPGAGAAFWTTYWLRRVFDAAVTQPQVIIADDAAAKGRIAAAIGLDAFIDDLAANCAAVRRLSPSTEVFMFDRPWNRRGPFDFPYYRVSSVREMLDRVLSPADREEQSRAVAA